MSENKDILVIGSANMDLIMQVDRLPKVGETVTGGVFSRAFGGKGANQAVGAARAGGKVAFAGCVGADDFGNAMVDNLKQDGIDVGLVRQTPEAATGTALIIVDKAGRNQITVAPGANYALRPHHVDALTERMEQAALILLQCELDNDTLDHILAKAATMERAVVLNLAPARPLTDDQLRSLAWLIVNETEAAFLTGKAVTGEASAREAAGLLRKKTGGGVIITLGENGSLVSSGRSTFHVPAFPVKAVDTTAAGDVYCGALAVAFVEGQPVEDAVRFAGAAAALAVTRLGAQPSAPAREAIERMLKTAAEG